MERRAKIVGTLGPASSNEAVLHQLVEAGLDVVRLNLSHGSHDGHRATLATLRKVTAERGCHVPIVADLMGPRYRLGTLAQPRVLADGERVRLGGGDADLPVDDPGFLRHLRVGERVLVDHGLVELRIEASRGGYLDAVVVAGGTVSTRKGINLPDSTLPFTISQKDEDDIRFAVEEEIDYLAASYVATAEDVRLVRHFARRAGADLPVVAKLERLAAVDQLDSLVAEADAVMVARGDLGVEVPLDRVPVLQKEIIAAGRRAGKPTIVATQMLESMIEHPRPTRAEASDVANAVFDGADALMLSGETAAGRYPVESVRTMESIIVRAEGWIAERPHGIERRRPVAAAVTPTENDARDAAEIPDVISAAAAHAAEGLGVRCIVAYSQGGFTARLIARHRPNAPILAITPDPALARRVQLVWGVRPFVLDAELQHVDDVVRVVERQLLAAGIVSVGDRILVLMGDPIHERPLTNLLRAHEVRG